MDAGIRRRPQSGWGREGVGIVQSSLNKKLNSKGCQEFHPKSVHWQVRGTAVANTSKGQRNNACTRCTYLYTLTHSYNTCGRSYLGR